MCIKDPSIEGDGTIFRFVPILLLLLLHIHKLCTKYYVHKTAGWVCICVCNSGSGSVCVVMVEYVVLICTSFDL
jgi:hypothetical protein